jgi:orotidine-5'-phosphate decarboxylase
MAVLRDTIAAARDSGALVILDTKRGDIGSTAGAYGEAYLGTCSPYGADAMTVHAYLGMAALQPIIAVARRREAGVFVVVRSSDPAGDALQQAAMADGRTVAEALADDIAADGSALVGAVLGATIAADELRSLAARMPAAPLLVPGIGAQGATVADVRRALGPHYSRAILAVSRAVACAGPDVAALQGQVARLVAEAGAAG